MEFVLPTPVGLDRNKVPTSSVTTVLGPVGNGIFKLVTAYPGEPTMDN
jgi:hypothetical protein